MFSETQRKVTVVFVLALIVSYSIIFISCDRSVHSNGGKNIFRYNEASGIVNLDPAFARDQAHIWVCNQLYNGLVQLDDNLIPRPCIAKRWEISEDGLTYRFHLRDDVFFVDKLLFPLGNRKVTASDFVYSFKRLVAPETASPGAWVFSKVNNMGGEYNFFAEDDSTLRIELSTPFPPFLGILAMQYCSVIPHEAVQKYGKEFRKHPVGTGPFYLKNWEENVKMVLRKNENYFEVKDGDTLPFLDAIAISFYTDKMTAFLEFTQGNLDFISGIDPAYKDEVLNRSGSLREKYQGQFQMLTAPYLNTEYLGILVNPEKYTEGAHPLLKKEVRQAMNYGFDRKKMVHYFRNEVGIPGNYGMIPAGMPAYDSDAGYGYHYDPQKSRMLLSKAGYNISNPVPEISLVTTPDYLDLCKYVQSQLNEVGFTIQIEVAPPAAVIERRAQSRVKFFRASWIADYPDEENYLSLFYSENFAPMGPNYTHFANRHFDSLYRKSVDEPDLVKRLKLYREMDSIVMEESPVLVLYYDKAVRFVRNNIEGMTVNPINLLNLKTINKQTAVN